MAEDEAKAVEVYEVGVADLPGDPWIVGGTITGPSVWTQPPPVLCMGDWNGNIKLRLDLMSDPPTVWVDPDLAWDTAAKLFWNAVHRVMGRPAPFPDID